MDNVKLYRPRFKQEQRLLRSEDTGYQTYYAFPALKRVGDRALVTVKSGQKHWGDAEAVLTQLTLDIPGQQMLSRDVIYHTSGFTPQMGEIVQMPNGDVCVYIDLQKSESNVRVGMWELRSRDGGRTYPISRAVGAVDGVVYGYPMSMAEKRGTVYMLVMTFDYLPGGGYRQVDVIRSDDSGESWHFVRNLTKEFGFPFNECDLLATDEGFLMFTRGETDRRDRKNSLDDFASGQHILRLDADFRVIQARDLRHETSFFTLTGRPRLYFIQEQLCLFTRQWNEDAQNRLMSLDMFRLNPETLEVLSRVRLDAPRFPHQDGHYPVAYVQDGMLHVVTYITCDKDERETFTQKCDLVQLSFRLEEVLSLGEET